MTIYFIALIAILALAAVVIFHEVMNAKNRFEDSESKRELLELFLQGVAAGLDSEGKNVDLVLRRLGYNGPEMTQEILKQKDEGDISTTDEPFVPDHELAFDVEAAMNQEGAQWADQEQGLFPMLDLDPGLQGPKAE